MSKIKFSDDNVFLALEEQAIDGQLDYSEFPPEEYKYFSKLARLGHLNRHKGWSAEVCEQKQEEYREQYRREKERADKYINGMKRFNDLRIRHAEAVSAIYKADDPQSVLDNALTALEALLDEPGFKTRITKKIETLRQGAPESLQGTTPQTGESPHA
jgi:hypothetical protein